MNREIAEAVAIHFSGASWAIEAAKQSAMEAAYEHMRPSVLYRPHLSADGTMWCALYGDNLQEGVAGFGETPAAAMAAFDTAWLSERTPTATRLAIKAADGAPEVEG